MHNRKQKKVTLFLLLPEMALDLVDIDDLLDVGIVSFSCLMALITVVRYSSHLSLFTQFNSIIGLHVSRHLESHC